jgi:hypothetical protein
MVFLIHHGFQFSWWLSTGQQASASLATYNHLQGSDILLRKPGLEKIGTGSSGSTGTSFRSGFRTRSQFRLISSINNALPPLPGIEKCNIKLSLSEPRSEWKIFVS